MSPFTLITALPSFISLEQHRELVASTPGSFSDIPPVLRHKEENVSVAIDPPLEGFGTEDCTSGTLYIIESVLVFMSITGRGFQVEYPSVTLHAVSRADSGPSIYCQLDDPPTADDGGQLGEDEGSEMKELVIVPSPGSLDTIFENLSICASLHPDPASLSDGLDDDAFVNADGNGLEAFDGDESQELSEVGRVRSNFVNNSRYAPY
ncbi:hypothetical protein WOLCODRAFT_89932 [Wolfiporia cocos MD-104 SS10]|uniref:Regulator of volume decrease after cellular swelling-domain-containing protein n=1 Tax=Wolfiporia cocos (strain MD-104) TaxID=742152 RepID=A0A2H3K2L8_WOLCO|nr:hypothetical protein WOLCODRAFT_89932 [Wolfiporia cocos MD-104 SS10]